MIVCSDLVVVDFDDKEDADGILLRLRRLGRNTLWILRMLVRKAQAEKVLAEFSDVRARVIRTSLSPDQEKRL